VKLAPFGLATSLLFVAAPAPAASYSFITDYYGYSWETAGELPGLPYASPTSLQADTVWQAVGVVDGLELPLMANLDTNELTFALLDAHQDGARVFIASGVDARRGPWTEYQVFYTDGATFNLYLDPSMNHEWGTNPPNGTAPSTFTDGTAYLTATCHNMSSFLTVYSNTGDEIGSFETDLTFNGGSNWYQLNYVANGYSFAGIARRPEASIPAGYKERVDGQQFVSPRKPVAWGAIKGLYGR
jgi:hypothetical protein